MEISVTHEAKCYFTNRGLNGVIRLQPSVFRLELNLNSFKYPLIVGCRYMNVYVEHKCFTSSRNEIKAKMANITGLLEKDSHHFEGKVGR